MFFDPFWKSKYDKSLLLYDSAIVNIATMVRTANSPHVILIHVKMDQHALSPKPS